MKQEIIIKNIDRVDLHEARKFIVNGMHLHWYVSNKLELYLYSKYALYSYYIKSTTILTAYYQNKLVGFLFAKFKNEQATLKPLRYKIYCLIFEKLMKLIGYGNANNTYDDANKKMLKDFKVNHQIDGEITFFAVNENLKGKGIGTLLLEKLEHMHKGQVVYLFSDNGSTYQFYLHRGFKKSKSKEINLTLKNDKSIVLTCFLFSKRL